MTAALLRRVEEYQSFTVCDSAGTPLFTDPSFGNLIRIVQPVVPVLVYEFFASLEVDKHSIE